MKNLKNILTALAFVFAIGAAFAFTAPADTLVFNAKMQQSDCALAIVDPECSDNQNGAACQYQGVNTVDIDETSCLTASILRRPQ